MFGLRGLERSGGRFGSLFVGGGAVFPSRLGFGSGSIFRGFILLTQIVTGNKR